MIITIDGQQVREKVPWLAALAERLGFPVSGYRGFISALIAWTCLQKNVPFDDVAAIIDLARQMEIRWEEARLWVNDVEVTEEIRSAEVTQGASQVAVIAEVREALNEVQRRIADTQDLVTEGRDQGTVVFPHAECKFFLNASAEERARRRYLELTNQNQEAEYETILDQIQERDERDATREIAPLKPAADAIQIDSTELTPDRVLDELEETARQKMN
ncbi:MAG: (d)CMP kinase [Planctomycetaceae bacterium]